MECGGAQFVRPHAGESREALVLERGIPDAPPCAMLPCRSLASRSACFTYLCFLAACAAPTPPKEPAGGPAATTAASIAAPRATSPASRNSASASAAVVTEPVVECDLVCERARIAPRSADTPDYHAKATANANAVLEAMHPELLECYKTRVSANPNAHAFITVDIVIGPDGAVRTVDTTGGALLGERTMGCIVERIKRASFDPPHGGGTLHIQVPFSLRKAGPGDATL